MNDHHYENSAMNIVASNVISLPEAGRSDAAPASTTTTAPTTGADPGPGDPAVASGTDVQNFGQILSDSLAKGRAPVQAAADPALAAAAAAAVQRVTSGSSEPADKRITTDLPGVEPIGAAAGKAVDPTKSAKPGESDDPATDPVSTDLSSQLALVAQWAGVQPAPVTTAPGKTARPAGDDTSANGPGLTTKIDDVRAANGTTTVAPAATLDVGQVQAAALPGALEAAAFALGQSARATGSSNVGAVASAKADPLKTGETTTLTTAEITTDAVDKLVALAGGSHVGTSPDPSSFTSQFVAQISAQVSNAQNALGAVPTTAASAALQEPVGSGAWSHELGQTALRMATNDLQNASLRLNPEHLGPLDVQMRIDNGVAHMQFTAAHAETRQALESSRSTLDQMFSDQGIKLGDWSVGNSSQQGAFARNTAGTAQGDGAAAGDGDAVAEDALPMTVTTRPLGLVDTFA